MCIPDQQSENLQRLLQGGFHLSTIRTIESGDDTDFSDGADGQSLQELLPAESVIDCHYNYIDFHYAKDLIITRKGAVSAKKDEWGIIPGSMGTKSYIVKGLGNNASYCSCSHGAGRIMSRRKAKERISLEEHISDTAGVECKKDLSVIDESPKAYKDIDAVMESQKDLVEIQHTLKQILCVKG